MKQSTEVILDIKNKPNNITFGTVSVVFIQDPFNPVSSKKAKTDLHGRTLDTYIEGFCLGGKYLVKLNNKIVDSNFNEYIVQPNDIIVYTPLVSGGGGGGGKQIVAIVAMIALTVATAGAAAPLTASLGAAMGITGVGLTVLSVSLMVAGSLLINAILAPSSSSGSGITSPDTESSTYSWSGIQTSRDLNLPIPVLYGTHALGGTVINNRFYYKGSDDWLAIQLALCHGEIEEITSNDITVQESKFSSFVGNPVGTDGFFDYTDGSFDQPIMTGFSDSIYNNGNVGRKVTHNDTYTFTTESTNIDFFRLHFEFPKGLYHMDTQGKKSSRTVNITAQYRKVGDTTWRYLYTSVPVYKVEYKYRSYALFGEGIGYYWTTEYIGVPIETRSTLTHYDTVNYLTFKSSSSVALKKYFEPRNEEGKIITLPAGQYEFRVTRTTPDDSETDVYNISDSHVRFIEEINSADINYGGVALLGINIKATDQLSSQRPDFVTTVTRKPLYLAGAYRASTNPAWICYDILTNKHYGMGIDDSKLNIVEFNRWAAFCDGIINNTYNIAKPATELTSINTQSGMLVIPETELPTGELLSLAGLNKNLSTLTGTGYTYVNGTLVDTALSINSITKITRIYEASNPYRADGFYYYVKFKFPVKLGTTIQYDLVHKTVETELTPKLKFNGVFDTTSDIWTSLQDVARVGRGQVILQGTKYSCIYDSVKTVSGLYNASNSTNVTVNYINQSDIASELELQYADSAIGYEMTSISIQDADAMASGIRSNKATHTVKGISTEAEALVYGRYLLATSKYIRRVVTLDADIESITQSVGDLIAVQTDVTQYGKGGMVKSVVGQVVVLDDTMYLEYGSTYTLKIKRKTDDFIKDYTFIAGNVSPLDYTMFNTFTETPLGVITFDELSLVVYEESDTHISTNTLIIPEGYEISKEDRYSFGIQNSDSILCVITDISRDGELTRTITAAEYNESILDFNYDNDVLQRISPTIRPKNSISNIQISDRLVKSDSGNTVAMMSLTWDSTVSSYYNMYIMEDDFKNYLVTSIKGNRYEYAAVELTPETPYRIYIEDANDMGVIAYKDYTITSFSSPPNDITDVIISSKGASLEFNVNYIDEPLDFSHHEIFLDGTLISKQLSNQFILPAVVGRLSYDFSIRPIDMINKKGNFIYKTFEVVKPAVTAVSYSQEKEYIKFDITSDKGSFDIDYYEITYPGHIITTKETSVTIIANWVGSVDFIFRAYDVLGNTNGTLTTSVAVTVPTVQNLTSSIDVKDAVIRWNSPTTGLPIDYYEIEYDSKVYKTKSNQYRVPVYWGGSKEFKVRAVNTLGGISSNSTTTVNIINGSMTTFQTEVIDNNVLLKWSATPGSLPIENFMLYKGVDELSLETIGEKKGTFTTIFENSAGTYTYWMAPIDSAGNIGTKLSATTMVNEPPDYVLNVDWYSEFTGTLSNARLEDGLMYLPITVNETIENHFLSRGWASAQEQVDAGYNMWIEPFNSNGSYSEVFDYGTLLASSMITVNIDKTIIKGSPNLVVTISLSQDGISYVDYYNQEQVYGTGFRFVKVTIDVSGTDSALSISTINVRLDSKLKNDAGTGTVVNANDGVLVNFNKTFIDVISIQVSPTGTTPMYAVYDFVDAPNPTEFLVYLYDTAGNRTTGSFSWGVRGY